MVPGLKKSWTLLSSQRGHQVLLKPPRECRYLCTFSRMYTCPWCFLSYVGYCSLCCEKKKMFLTMKLYSGGKYIFLSTKNNYSPARSLMCFWSQLFWPPKDISQTACGSASKLCVSLPCGLVEFGLCRHFLVILTDGWDVSFNGNDE